MSYFQARLAEVQIPPKKPQKYLFHVPRTNFRNPPRDRWAVGGISYYSKKRSEITHPLIGGIRMRAQIIAAPLFLVLVIVFFLIRINRESKR